MIRHLLDLSTNDLKVLALAMRSGRLSPPFSDIALRRVVSRGASAAMLGELSRLAEEGWTPRQMATFFEGVASDRTARRSLEDALDLVTTGPEIVGADNRDTSVVVRDLFAGANVSALLAGYAVHQGQLVFQTLADRMRTRPELRVQIALDIQREPRDASTAHKIIRRFGQRFRAEQWPQERPLPEVYYDPRSLAPWGEKRACMHAKCVVVDARHVFISSANFTEAAQHRNIEVGLLLDSETLAERLSRFFSLMISDGSLQRLPF